MRFMPKVTIKEDFCKGCSLCVSVCPKRVLELDADRLNGKGYHPARLTDHERCISCAMCAVICPEVAITVTREKQKAAPAGKDGASNA